MVSGDIHDRQPAILGPEQWNDWPTGPPDDAKAILADACEPALAYYAVRKDVGSPKNDRPDLVEPIAV